MKKKKYFIPFVGAGLLFISTASFGAEEETFNSSLSVGAEINHLSLTNSKVEGVEIGFDSATVLAAKLDYRLLQNWTLRIGTGSFETDIEAGLDDRFEHYGSFKQKTYSLMLLYMTETSKRSPFKMFIGGGLSYHINDIDKESQSPAISDFFAKNRTISNIENSIGAHGTLGFKYMVSDHLLVGLSLSLSATDAKVDVTYPDSTVRESNLSLNAISVGTALEYQY
ncbi:MAG: porin family protein [Deltaproteobacteria bacterium]|nr:porin family protein [Deltaproteobacteria bacterium]